MEIEFANPTHAEVAEGSRDGIISGACLVWQDLTAVLPNYGNGPTRRLINGLTGYALPGRIMAVMGPSGSGKSTFLDALAGRLSANVVLSGNFILNGRKRTLNDSIAAYVTQESGFLGTLTVKETITYSAMLRLPSKTTRSEFNRIVERTISEMGLEECANTLVGHWHLRGISGGEKKRLSIALEILTQPRLLLLDEPTSGLDSASAFFVAQTLRSLALSGRTIISSIHQPSSEVFALFHDLLLLSNGETIYFGEAEKAIEVHYATLEAFDEQVLPNAKNGFLQLFAEAGFPCPTRRNPSDHFLRCTNSDFDNVNRTLTGSLRRRDKKNESAGLLTNLPTTEIRARLVQKYQTSKYAPRVMARTRELSSVGRTSAFEEIKGSQASWFKQLTTLTRRSFVNMNRDFGYYWLRIIVFVAVAASAGSIFFRVGENFTTSALIPRAACGGYVSGFMVFMTIGGFPSFIEEMKVFTKERLNRHYGVVVYLLSNFLSSFPFLAVMAACTSGIMYCMVKYHTGFTHFAYVVMDLYLSLAVIESCMIAIAAFVPNFLMCVMAGSGFVGLMMATAGYFRRFLDLPKIFWRYPVYYVNYMSWALQGAFKNEMIGLEFEPLVEGQPKIPGERILTAYLGVPITHTKWWDLAVIAAILLAYRLLFLCALKFKERAFPIYRSYYAKTTLHHLQKRPSFRMTPSQPFSSKRHQVVHTLASQEGLNSPLHS